VEFHTEFPRGCRENRKYFLLFLPHLVELSIIRMLSDDVEIDPKSVWQLNRIRMHSHDGGLTRIGRWHG